MSNQVDSKSPDGDLKPEGEVQTKNAYELDEKPYSADHKEVAVEENNVKPEGVAQGDHSYDLDEKTRMAGYKADAMEAENTEHNMGVLQAVRAYPMASFWAFVISFTIVSCLRPLFPFHL